MTRVLAENINRDLFKGANGQLVVRNGIDAVVQLSKSAIEAQRGEMQFASNRGIPTKRTVWTGQADQQQFQFFCRQALVRIPDINQVTIFETEIQGDTLNYQATIITTFGTESFSGSV